jgi:hypothetical protein
LTLLVRSARLVSVALIVGVGLSQIWFRVTDWSLSDMDAYWNAALRLRSGQLLFPPLADESAADVYRYSPWFAAAWVPLTMLPKALVAAVWSMILLIASFLSLWPARGLGWTSLAVMALLGSFLIWAASVGNVQPLMVLGLVWAIRRRSGWLVIGAAASLKAVPILLAVVYLRRGEWKSFLLCLMAFAILVAPFLLVDRSHYPGSGDSPSPLLATTHPLVWLIVTGAAATAPLIVRGRHALFASTVAVLVALPRISLLDLTYLAVPASASRSREADDLRYHRDIPEHQRDSVVST